MKPNINYLYKARKTNYSFNEKFQRSLPKQPQKKHSLKRKKKQLGLVLHSSINSGKLTLVDAARP